MNFSNQPTALKYGKPSKKEIDYMKTIDLKEGGGQFENLII